MKTPRRLQSLVPEGLVDTVERPPMSGREAQAHVVRHGEHTRCARVYNEAQQRSFRQAVGPGVTGELDAATDDKPMMAALS